MKAPLHAVKEAVNVDMLLQSYGASIFISNENEIRSNCLVHGGTNVTSLCYNRSRKVFKCFGECGFTGDVFALIQAVEGCGFKEALQRALEFSGALNLTKAKETSQNDPPWLVAMKQAYQPNDTNQPINSALVERARKFYPNPYVTSKKFRQETIDYFEIGYCDFNEYFMNRAIIPIHDEHGVLVGYSGRDMKNSESTNKYRIKKGFKKAYCLYNLHRAKPFIDRQHPLVLVEGFGQTWRLTEAGIAPVVALMGKELSDRQEEMVLTHTTAVILALDFDEPGMEATMNIIKRLHDKVDIEVLTSRFGPNIDLGDMSIENAIECYESKMPAYLWVNTVYNQLRGDEMP